MVEELIGIRAIVGISGRIHTNGDLLRSDVDRSSGRSMSALRDVMDLQGRRVSQLTAQSAKSDGRDAAD
jgi:hypothetical protein